jgi:predicted ATPase/class 3 adenylate cyclase
VSLHDYTILFTDIEGSTRLWEQEGERMAAALARHDELARTAVVGHRGIVVKTTGDGLYAAFEDPLDALNATLTLQRSLADPAATNGIALRIRCGLHSGQIEQRDNDYFGPPVNRTARLMSAAHGGQVLLTQAVAGGVEARLPPEVSLRDLGSVRLKDLSQPEHVYQLVHPALRQDFPALRSLEATPNNLPQQLTSFIGREREVEEAKELLKSARLLTLLGMGGLGKTRLSLQVGADVMDAYPDGVWFVDLAPIRDDTLVASETAKVLGVQEEPGRSLAQTLGAHLRSRTLLLILDNCEHLVNASAALANALLRAAPDIRIIATSREALRVPGEQTYPVFPLAVPDRSASADVLSRSEAVQLFMDRARLQRPGFALTDKEAASLGLDAVAELCARLEGIPLALELAAARMRTLSIQDINKRLHDRFKLLTGGGRVLLERQQTLRALVAWSYDMLQESEQRLLERLSVFAGGFDLEAAETICGADPLEAAEIIDLLTSLVEKSLVMIDEGESGTRYRQLETIREFAREYLNKRDDAAAIAARHCDHYLLMAKAANKNLQGAEQAVWTRRVEAELDNLRAAINLALSGEVDPILAVKFEVALMGFRFLRGYSTEGRKYIRAALGLPAVQASDVAHAHALYVGAVLADNQSDYAEAVRLLEPCLELRRRIGNPVDIAATLSMLGTVRLREDNPEQARLYDEEALGIFRGIHDKIGEAIELGHLGEICMHVSDDARASEYFERCLAIARAIDHSELQSECELYLGEIALYEGDVAAARQRFARSLEVSRDAENKRGGAMALWWTGKADVEERKYESARIRLDAAVKAFRSSEMTAEALACLEDHARLMQATGRIDDSVRLFAAAAAARERLVLRPPRRGSQRSEESIALARAAVGASAFEAAWKEGQGWQLDTAVQYALAPAPAQPVAA